ncbi:MAG: haloacid dehalogenase-like hydrolase [Oscillospiraceae bacterium]|nr:haloacid dehalogenase-like hydrolase [Oscillospiraceae bacterium]
MNVYDFDETIFTPDSSYAFVLYCLRHYPRAVLHAVPGMAGMGLLHAAKQADTKALKEKVFAFLTRLDNVDQIVSDFWKEKSGGLAQWYLAQRRDDDLIISASPEFLLRPVADALHVRLLATPMDRHTGRIIGRNCHDNEKVVRFYQAFPHESIDRFYSDSMSDTPLARISREAYLVNKGTCRPWPFHY